MGQHAVPDAGSKVCVRGELPGRGTGTRRDQSDSFPLLVVNQLHGLGNVAVVRDDDGTVVTIKPGIVQQVHGKVDVGSLFLGPDHVRVPP